MNWPALKPSISRRGFLRLAVIMGGLTSVASFLEACAKGGLETPAIVPTVPAKPVATSGATSVPRVSPAVSPRPTTMGEASKARVAFVKTRNRAEGVRRAIDVLGLNPVQGKSVLFKPNFNSAHSAPGSTHDDVLRALVRELREMGAKTITVADRSGMANTREVMEQKGVFAMGRELGFETIVLDELEEKDWVMVRPPGSHWQNGFPFARPCLEAEAIVQTCCLKTHRFGGHFTMSLKNSVGLVASSIPGNSYNYMRELHSSAHQRLMIAEINTAYSPALVVVDGVEAFVRGGPDSGERVWTEVVLAGTDRVAIDAVGVAVLRYFGTTPEVSQGAIFQQEQIARAVELGLGVDSSEQIELVTEDADSEVYAARIQEILRRG